MRIIHAPHTSGRIILSLIFFNLSLAGCGGGGGAASNLLGTNGQAGNNTYTIVDIGAMPGDTSSEANAINSVDQVVGTSYASATISSYHAFIWSSTTGMKKLGTLSGDTNSRALGINDLGQVVGISEGTLYTAFVWSSANGMQGIGGFTSGDYSSAFGIDASGSVAGNSFTLSSGQAFRWTQRDGLQTLWMLSGDINSTALGCSPSGFIAGYSRDTTSSHACIWASSGGAKSLGKLSGNTDSEALAVNNAGQVIGNSYTSVPGSSLETYKSYRAFLWSQNGGMISLGILPGDTSSFAAAINLQGLVVGTSENLAGSSPTTPRAFLWTSSTGIVDLNTRIPSNTGWILTGATGINDSGKIVGNGTLNGVQHAFLLIPAGRAAPIQVSHGPR